MKDYTKYTNEELKDAQAEMTKDVMNLAKSMGGRPSGVFTKYPHIKDAWYAIGAESENRGIDHLVEKAIANKYK